MKRFVLAMACACACASTAVAIPISANFTTSGSSGDWTYDFTFTNNMSPAAMALYFVGVADADADHYVGSPPANYVAYGNWNTSSAGGPDINFNMSWIETSYDTLMPGSSLGGFKVHDTAAAQKTSFDFFGYGYGRGVEYPGDDYFYLNWNPGFVGVATAGSSAAPEPASWALMLGGFGAIGGALRSRRKATVAFG